MGNNYHFLKILARERLSPSCDLMACSHTMLKKTPLDTSLMQKEKNYEVLEYQNLNIITRAEWKISSAQLHKYQ